MPRLNRTRKLQTIILVLFVTSVAYAKITGPDAGYTNAPGDLGNCTACHDTYEQSKRRSGQRSYDPVFPRSILPGSSTPSR